MSATSPDQHPSIAKANLRRAVRASVAGITPDQRQILSSAALARLLSRPEWHHAQRILGYLPLKDELDLAPALESALRAGKMIALPRFIPESGDYAAAVLSQSIASLQKGPFGILEPPPTSPVLSLNQLDFILVPGVAFDRFGRRLGRGKGFYDRLLANVSATSIKCGIAADEQIVTGIPAEPHDIPMDFLLTPTRWIAADRSSA